MIPISLRFALSLTVSEIGKLREKRETENHKILSQSAILYPIVTKTFSGRRSLFWVDTAKFRAISPARLV